MNTVSNTRGGENINEIISGKRSNTQSAPDVISQILTNFFSALSKAYT